MRHHLSGRQLSRNASHRKALMRNMATALLRYETIRTTLPKAKELRRVVEPLITLGKSDSLAGRRRAFAQLRDDEIVTKLFEDIGPRFKARAGGYTRILKMESRPGDCGADGADAARGQGRRPGGGRRAAEEAGGEARAQEGDACRGGWRQGQAAPQEGRRGLNDFHSIQAASAASLVASGEAGVYPGFLFAGSARGRRPSFGGFNTLCLH